MRLKKPALANIGIDVDAAVIENSQWLKSEIVGLLLIQSDVFTYLPGIHLVNFPDTLVYLDPPYLMETRSCKQPIYKYEFSTLALHRKLLGVIKSLPCMVMISGYYSDLYAEQLQGWRTATFQAQTRGGRTATEWVWMNFPPPLELHDYRYLGSNFRERERIKRKQARWTNRLKTMPDLERHAILAAIEELRSNPSPEMVGLPATSSGMGV
jgi:hypothetical protein